MNRERALGSNLICCMNNHVWSTDFQILPFSMFNEWRDRRHITSVYPDHRKLNVRKKQTETIEEEVETHVKYMVADNWPPISGLKTAALLLRLISTQYPFHRKSWGASYTGTYSAMVLFMVCGRGRWFGRTPHFLKEDAAVTRNSRDRFQTFSCVYDYGL